jgi:hypothetical protein
LALENKITLNIVYGAVTLASAAFSVKVAADAYESFKRTEYYSQQTGQIQAQTE